jgi:hypothetical protein
MMGPWVTVGDPFADDTAGNSLQSQGTFILRYPDGGEDDYIYLADRWVPEDLGASTYVWLPFTMRDERPAIAWCESWTPNLSTTTREIHRP